MHWLHMAQSEVIHEVAFSLEPDWFWNIKGELPFIKVSIHIATHYLIV